MADEFLPKLLRRLRGLRWIIESTRSGHYRVRPPDGDAVVIISATPSDWRARHRILSDLRKHGFSWPEGPPLRCRRRKMREAERAGGPEQDQGSANASDETAPECPPTFEARVGTILKAARVGANLEEDEWATMLDVPTATVRAWEAGLIAPESKHWPFLVDLAPDLDPLLRAAFGETYLTGPAIRYARCVAKMSQTELAKALGVAGPTVSLWEAGKHQPRGVGRAKLIERFPVLAGVLRGTDGTNEPSTDMRDSTGSGPVDEAVRPCATEVGSPGAPTPEPPVTALTCPANAVRIVAAAKRSPYRDDLRGLLRAVSDSGITIDDVLLLLE